MEIKSKYNVGDKVWTNVRNENNDIVIIETLILSIHIDNKGLFYQVEGYRIGGEVKREYELFDSEDDCILASKDDFLKLYCSRLESELNAEDHTASFGTQHELFEYIHRLAIKQGKKIKITVEVK